MAVTARRSRGNLRREPSEAIEEDEPSQAAIPDSDDEIEAPPATRAPTKGKKGKKSVEDKVEIDANMLDELGDQPIDRASAAKLVGMSEDWKRMRETIHSNSYSLIRDVAATMAEFDEKDDAEGVSTTDTFGLCAFTYMYDIASCRARANYEESH